MVYSGKKRFKAFLAGVIFRFLGKGMKACASFDSRVRDEVSGWDEASRIMLKIESYGPCMVLEVKDGMLVYLGSKEMESSLAIYFKNIEAALLVLTGRIGIAQAYAEHRFGMRGDIAFGMSLVRCLKIVQAYLFPKFIAKRVLKRIPHKEKSSVRVYWSIIFG